MNRPTFTIVQVYEEGRLPFYHFDVYRIGDLEEMEEIGYDDYFFGEGVCMIEWADLIRELLPDQITAVKIEKDLKRLRLSEDHVGRAGRRYRKTVGK